jgi:hypothetical protein
LEPLAFALVLWLASVLALASALALPSETCPASVWRSLDAVPGSWSAGAASRGRVLSALAAVSSVRRCDADDCCAPGPARSFVLLAAVLSTKAPKLSVPTDWSGRAAFGGAVGRDRLAGTSVVTLYTGSLSRWI